MFYYIEGNISVIDSGVAVVDAGGVGYLVNTTVYTISRLEPGKKARLYISESVREDAFDLYGFYDLSEKKSFELLTSVSGVGPKAAISILSTVTSEELALAVLSEDDKPLTRAPGVGKRIAQRIILELKDKISKESASFSKGSGSGALPQTVGGGNKLAEATAALMVLGYSQGEINIALRGADVERMTAEELIRYALKNS